ncbi:MAG: serine/threonine-protein phosphatase [Clostridia bacterium]|nr:serine/threonine-protein phosphatase [Clostridia bacterium]
MISFSRISKPGSRPVNEDCVAGIKKDNKYLFILCDGLGGHGSGDVASGTAAESFSQEFEKYSGDIIGFFKEAYIRAQENIGMRQQTDDSMSAMKTTVVALIIDGEVAGWSHIGDSRLYYFAQGNLVSRTADHSVPQMLYKSGEIEESEIRFHPDRNKLLRALGDTAGNPQYTVSDVLVLEDDSAFLLCSDGFWEYITEDTMVKSLIESADADEWLRKMSEEVEKNNCGKKSDNYSAVAVMIKGGTAL